MLDSDEEFMKYNFVALLVEKMIKKFPKSAILRIHSSFIQISKLKNEFKANFELMQCSLCNPSLQNKFFIFRRRIEMQKTLAMKN